MNLTQAQYRIEEEAIGIGIQNYMTAKNQAEARKNVTNLSPENFLMRSALLKVAAKIEEHLEGNSRGATAYRRIREVLMRMDAAEVAFITLQTAFSIAKDAKWNVASNIVAQNIRKHLDYVRFKKEMPGYLKAVEETMNSKNTKYKATVLKMTMDKKGIDREPWGQDMAFCMQLGSLCLFKMVEAVDLFERKLVNDSTGKSTAYLAKTEQTLKWLEEAHKQCAAMSVQYLPMVIPPADWSSEYDGGFLNSEGAYRIPAVRSRYNDARKKTCREASMDSVYASLNALQATPFRINERVLEVMQEAKLTGLGGLPKPDLEMLLPQPFWKSDAEYQRIAKRDPQRIKAWKIERTKVYDMFMRDRSKRMVVHWQTWIANKFKEFNKIYFVWNMDWRGRVYPVQQYLNPQADGNGKALLEFADGKRLGEKGVYWLAVHGANSFGVDKLPMDERVQWVRDHEEAIVDSAMNPLDGGRFWCGADKPFMFLAFCFEWLGVVQQGEDFVSHLPVNMDGSCSGLQHYSAMLKDEIGGRHVNLVPSDRPSDIYARVAQVASEIVAKDTENEMAGEWNGKIDRGIAKRNTMTWAYSATLYGFTDQLQDELRKRDEKEQLKGGDSYLSSSAVNPKAAGYLAKVNMAAISQVVVKAFAAMEWLQTVAKAVAKANRDIEWVTPSGMRVIQRYMKSKTKRVDVFQGKIKVRVNVSEDTAEHDAARNSAGIAPNFIHSLDASHLTMTVNRCVEAGITNFMMIHDSFGTHAADIPAMNRILRETFVEMYSANALEDFRDQLEAQLPPEVFKALPQIPTQGSLDLTQVLKSVYFFA